MSSFVFHILIFLQPPRVSSQPRHRAHLGRTCHQSTPMVYLIKGWSWGSESFARSATRVRKLRFIGSRYGRPHVGRRHDWIQSFRTILDPCNTTLRHKRSYRVRRCGVGGWLCCLSVSYTHLTLPTIY